MGVLLLKSLVYGIIEGVTEWLPVSSTGHLILLEDILTLQVGTQVHPLFASEFWELFLVTVQLGAIFAVLTTYHTRLLAPLFKHETRWSAVGLWSRVIVGCIPAGIAGVAVDAILTRICGKDMDGLFYNGVTVAAMLMLYGVLFIMAERVRRGKTEEACDLAELPFGKCLGVGLFQVLSLVPGTSRSGATVLGGMLAGLARPVAAEFSFFLGIPTMCGASALKCTKFFFEGNGLTGEELAMLVAGSVTAFLCSLMAIRVLLDFVRRHTFTAFGVYRILLGIAVLGTLIL